MLLLRSKTLDTNDDEDFLIDSLKPPSAFSAKPICFRSTLVARQLGEFRQQLVHLAGAHFREQARE